MDSSEPIPLTLELHAQGLMMLYITVENHEHVRSCACHLCEVACKDLKQISPSRADISLSKTHQKVHLWIPCYDFYSLDTLLWLLPQIFKCSSAHNSEVNDPILLKIKLDRDFMSVLDICKIEADLKIRGPWWSYIAHLSKQICILTVEVSAKLNALRFMYKFYSPPPPSPQLKAMFFSF